MAQVEVLAATTAAGSSSDIVVAAGETVAVGAFASTGSISSHFVGTLERLIGEDDYEPVTGFAFGLGNTNAAITAPGTYRVSKGASLQAIGFVTDDGA